MDLPIREDPADRRIRPGAILSTQGTHTAGHNTSTDINLTLKIPLCSLVCLFILETVTKLKTLKGAARYAGLLLAPVEASGLWAMPFLWAKK